MDYHTLKLIHILGATLLYGTGLGSAFYLYFAFRGGDIAAIRQVARLVVWADLVFTTPAVLLQPLTGWAMFVRAPLPDPWLLWVLGLYGLVGACWIPVVFIQVRLRDLALRSERVSDEMRRWMRLWVALGVPAFGAGPVLYGLMVFKPALGLTP
jgi:uncharacterized membrane protein